MSLSSKSDLRIDWASHAAAKYACETWHYSRRLPSGKLVKIGAWEDGKFIGVVLFGLGATPNLSKAYGISMTECCELTRVALRAHSTPVSRIVAIAIKKLMAFCPGVRLIVSFADTAQGHHGGIYQAGNWIYSGSVRLDTWVIKGKKMHPRSVVAKYGTQADAAIKGIDPNAHKIWGDKHRYLMPLDDEMRAKVLPLAQPYPKRPKQETTGTTGTSAGQNRPGRSNNPPAAGPEPA